MNRNTIAVVLIAALCISIAAPIDADAAAFLAAVPVIWAVAAAARVTVAVANNDDDSQQSQQAVNQNKPALKESQPEFAKVESSNNGSGDSY